MSEFEKSTKGEGHKNMEIPVKEIGQLLDEFSEKLPKLLGGIQKSYYSPENGANAGKAIGAFYKELIESGIPADMALKLTENYMISIKDVVKVVNNEEKG